MADLIPEDFNTMILKKIPIGQCFKLMRPGMLSETYQKRVGLLDCGRRSFNAISIDPQNKKIMYHLFSDYEEVKLVQCRTDFFRIDVCAICEKHIDVTMDDVFVSKRGDHRVLCYQCVDDIIISKFEHMKGYVPFDDLPDNVYFVTMSNSKVNTFIWKKIPGLAIRGKYKNAMLYRPKTSDENVGFVKFERQELVRPLRQIDIAPIMKFIDAEVGSIFVVGNILGEKVFRKIDVRPASNPKYNSMSVNTIIVSPKSLQGETEFWTDDDTIITLVEIDE